MTARAPKQTPKAINSRERYQRLRQEGRCSWCGKPVEWDRDALCRTCLKLTNARRVVRDKNYGARMARMGVVIPPREEVDDV